MLRWKCECGEINCSCRRSCKKCEKKRSEHPDWVIQ